MPIARARRYALLWSCAAFFLLSTGCGVGIVGQWKGVEAIPSRQVLFIEKAAFRQDGTFAATVTRQGHTQVETGEYSFNGFKLTLRPSAGGKRSYNANVRFSRLELIDGPRKVIMKKQ